MYSIGEYGHKDLTFWFQGAIHVGHQKFNFCRILMVMCTIRTNIGGSALFGLFEGDIDRAPLKGI